MEKVIDCCRPMCVIYPLMVLAGEQHMMLYAGLICHHTQISLVGKWIDPN